MEQDLGEKSQVIAEYEARFVQVRDAFSQDRHNTALEQEAFRRDVIGSEEKSEKLEMRV